MKHKSDVNSAALKIYTHRFHTTFGSTLNAGKGNKSFLVAGFTVHWHLCRHFVMKHKVSGGMGKYRLPEGTELF